MAIFLKRSIDADAAQYITAAGISNKEAIYKLNKFIEGLKNLDLWDDLDECWIFPEGYNTNEGDYLGLKLKPAKLMITASRLPEGARTTDTSYIELHNSNGGFVSGATIFSILDVTDGVYANLVGQMHSYSPPNYTSSLNTILSGGSIFVVGGAQPDRMGYTGQTASVYPTPVGAGFQSFCARQNPTTIFCNYANQQVTASSSTTTFEIMQPIRIGYPETGYAGIDLTAKMALIFSVCISDAQHDALKTLCEIFN